MTRDLTDHVREKQEAEGPPINQPVTNAQAKEAHDLCGRALASDHVAPGGYADLLMGHVLHLLCDRAVAMNIIAELADETCSIDWGRTVYDGKGCDCNICRARALITAVEEERE